MVMNTFFHERRNFLDIWVSIEETTYVLMHKAIQFVFKFDFATVIKLQRYLTG
jgi:hypothetical protein